MHELSLISKTEDETQRYGYLFAQICRDDAVVLLSGTLGTGKTTFVKGIASGFGVKQPINSPSFNIMGTYRGDRYKLLHIDAYREKSLTWAALDLDDIVTSPFCCVIEWPENFSDIPTSLKHFYVNIDLDGDNRAISIATDDKIFLYELASRN
jgi:tRNA threonylcarbamoyladenosine biosynthesis protein TsaE